MGMSLSQLQETVKDRESWHAAFHGGFHGSQRTGHDLVTEQQSKQIWGMGIKSKVTKGLGCRPGVRNWRSSTKHRKETENFQLRFGFPGHDEGVLI